MGKKIIIQRRALSTDKAQVIAQAKKEYKQSLDLVQSKRQSFRDRLRLYNNQKKQKDKVAILTIYTTITTLLAVYYSDEITVGFKGRKIGQEVHAENLRNLAKFDFDEMNLDVQNYFTQWDRLFYGVGLRDMSSWDNETKTPIGISKDPLSWLPDPRGSFNNFRYYGFEIERTKAEMTEDRGFIDLKNLRSSKSSGSELERTQQARREAQGLDDPSLEDEDYKGKVYHQFDWCTILQEKDGSYRKYLVTFANDFDIIIRLEKLKAVTDEEKKDPSKIPFPLATNYYSPLRNDPFGTSTCDLTEDKQRHKSVMTNLMFLKEKAGLYPNYIYNRQKILNRRQLDYGINKFVGVDGPVGDDIIKVVPRDPNKASTFNLNQSLDQEVELATGAGRVASGVLSEESRTLGEVQQATANANLRYILGSRINAWGDKYFWRLWFRKYRENFSGADEKIIRMESGFGSQFSILKRKDFITIKDPDIYVSSKLELEGKKQKALRSLSTIAPMILQDPTKPKASKNYLQRQMLRLSNITQEQINVIVPKDADEIWAEQENEILNRNEFLEINPKEDHLSHNVIHSQAEKTMAVKNHIEAHWQAYIVSGQSEQDRELEQLTGQNNQNKSANIAQNAAAQQEIKQTPKGAATQNVESQGV